MPGEPAGRRGGEWCVKAAGRHTDDHTKEDLELADRRGLARRHESDAQECPAREHDRARSVAIGERAP